MWSSNFFLHLDSLPFNIHRVISINELIQTSSRELVIGFLFSSLHCGRSEQKLGPVLQKCRGDGAAFHRLHQRQARPRPWRSELGLVLQGDVPSPRMQWNSVYFGSCSLPTAFAYWWGMIRGPTRLPVYPNSSAAITSCNTTSWCGPPWAPQNFIAPPLVSAARWPPYLFLAAFDELLGGQQA